MLLDAGAPPEEVDDNGMTAAMYAKAYSHRAVLVALKSAHRGRRAGREGASSSAGASQLSRPLWQQRGADFAPMLEVRASHGASSARGSSLAVPLTSSLCLSRVPSPSAAAAAPPQVRASSAGGRLALALMREAKRREGQARSASLSPSREDLEERIRRWA